MTSESRCDPEHLEIVRRGAAAIEEWRVTVDRPVLRLVGADLRGVDLRGARLRSAILDRADLAGADLSGADCTAMSAMSARLAADLRGARLDRAHLNRADLRSAYLQYASLWRTRLVDADMTEAVLGRTRIDTDLGVVKGLDAVRHHDPSSISLDALTRATGGPLPVIFLRGIGLSDVEIDFVRSLSVNPIEFFSAFISYHSAGADDRFAVKLHDHLQARGVRCWLDKHQVRVGDDFLEEINRGIRLWDKILLVCSERSLQSSWVRAEVERAFEKERQVERKHGPVKLVLPIDLDGYLFRGDCRFKYATDLRARSAAILRGWESDPAVFDQQFERIVAALRSDEDSRPEPPPSKFERRTD